MKKFPKLCRFKARNLAFVHIDGGKRKLYLGKWGAPETEAAYRRFIAELVADVPVVASSVRGGEDERVVCVAELADAFLLDRADYYVKNGKQTGQLDRFRAALEFPLRYFPATSVDEFGPKKLLFCRDKMEKKRAIRSVLRQHARQLFPLRYQMGRRSRTRSSGNARRAPNGSGAQTRQVDRPRSRAGRIGSRRRRRRDSSVSTRPSRGDGSDSTFDRNAARRSLRDAVRRRRNLRRRLALRFALRQNRLAPRRRSEEARPARPASSSDFDAVPRRKVGRSGRVPLLAARRRPRPSVRAPSQPQNAPYPLATQARRPSENTSLRRVVFVGALRENRQKGGNSRRSRALDAEPPAPPLRDGSSGQVRTRSGANHARTRPRRRYANLRRTRLPKSRANRRRNRLTGDEIQTGESGKRSRRSA